MNQALSSSGKIPFSIAKFVSSFCFVGFVPVIPGTFGSLAAMVPYFFLLAHWQAYLAVIVVLSALGIWAAAEMERRSNIVDPSFVVIDEVAGQLITLFLIPFSWLNILAGFFIFRALDIVKPPPARQAERLPGGWGIMMDDIIVGIYGNLILRLLIFIWDQLAM